jgi:transcriptional regulator with XRE-family HTH domain
MGRTCQDQPTDPQIKVCASGELQNVNQTQLAARAGLHASKISLIETSARNVTVSTLARVAYAFNTRIKIEFVPLKTKKR